MGATVTGTAKQVFRSDAVEKMARFGIGARGLVWLVVGLLALSVVLGGDEQTDRGGALRAIADKPFGEVLLVGLALGFLGYAAWQLLSAAVGHRDKDGAKRSASRALSLGKGLLYLGLALSTAQFLLRGGGQDQTGSRTAELMSHTGGRTAVGVIGAVLVIVGMVLAVRALMEKHSKRIESYRVPARLRRPVIVAGIVGLVGKGAVLALIGWFLVRAAVQFNAGEAKGLDAALQVLAQQTYGRVLLGAAVVGMLGYGIWSFLEAAYRKI